MPTGRVHRRRRVTALAAVAGVVVVGMALWTRGGPERIPGGTFVGGVDVGGLELDLARGAIARRARTMMSRPITITSPDAPSLRVVVQPEALGATPQVDAAMTMARDRGGFIDRVRSGAGFGGTRDVPLLFTFDPARLQELESRIQDELGTRPVPAGVAVSGDGLTVTRGRPGTGVDDARFRGRLARLPETISLNREPLPPPVTTEAALTARDAARRLLDSPPTVLAGTARWTPTRRQLLDALRFVPRTGTLAVELDPGVLGPLLRERFGGRERPVRDAEFRMRAGTLGIVPERAGLRIDVPAAATKIAGATTDAVVLPFRRLEPARTAASLKALGADAEVGGFSTEFPCCQPRVTNIRRAAQILDGTILPPNGRFDMNTAVGERTVERGFVAAPQISDGQFKEGVGGGVSQVATTLYNAAFFAGLELVAHTPHEVYISRYPMGREATISWGGPELTFVNDWAAPLYIAVKATDTSVSVHMYSRRLGRRVETTTGEPTGQIPAEITTVTDSTLAPGSQVTDQMIGGPGFSISYTRRVWRGDALIRDETFRWNYRPVNALIRVGPPAAPTSTAGPAGPASSGPATSSPSSPPPATSAPSSPAQAPAAAPTG